MASKGPLEAFWPSWRHLSGLLGSFLGASRGPEEDLMLNIIFGGLEFLGSAALELSWGRFLTSRGQFGIVLKGFWATGATAN